MTPDLVAAMSGTFASHDADAHAIIRLDNEALILRLHGAVAVVTTASRRWPTMLSNWCRLIQ